MGQKVRRVPVIQADNRYLDRQELIRCQGENCRNLVEASKSQQKRSLKPVLCILCRNKAKKL